MQKRVWITIFSVARAFLTNTGVIRTKSPIQTNEKPPFYALPTYTGAIGTKGGPKINTKGQVVHVSGKPIPGLYAAGNVTAGVSGPAYWGGGGTIGPAMLFGYICGINAAKEK